MAYQIVVIRMTLDDVQCHSATASFSKCDSCVQLCGRWQDFNWHSASRGPSVIELSFLCIQV